MVALIGCTAFESQVDEFPDAGPNGPDSSYAGVGQGIPFGEFGLTLEQFRPPYTGAVVLVSRSSVASVLRAAQDRKLRLVLNLAGGGGATAIRTAPSISSSGRRGSTRTGT